jgi:hypothetical protein
MKLFINEVNFTFKKSKNVNIHLIFFILVRPLNHPHYQRKTQEIYKFPQ